MPDEPKVLILVSRDFGELTNALTFARSPGLAVTLLVPDNIFEAIEGEPGIVRRRYRNPGDVLATVQSESPDVIMLFSGYLLVVNRIFDFASLESFLRDARISHTLVLTSDPFMGRLRVQDHADLRTHHPAAQWLLQHFERAASSLRDMAHVYTVPCADFPGSGKIAYRLSVQAERFSSRDGRALRLRETPCRLEEDRFWVFVVSGEDHRIQCDTRGAGEFARLLADRMADAHLAGRVPVVIAPTACVAALAAVLPPSIRHWVLPFCGFRVFEDLLLGAEHVFYWNEISNSILLRLANGLSFWTFDHGHLLRIMPGLRAAAHTCLHDSFEIHELDLAAPLSLVELTRRCEASYGARVAQALRLQTLNRPADAIRRALAQRMLAGMGDPAPVADPA